jgi:hypothetical protein
MCRAVRTDRWFCFRIDYIRKIKVGETCKEYEQYLREFQEIAKHTWGVAFDKNKKMQHIEIDLLIGKEEKHIIRRLERERRCGTFIQIDEQTYRFMADVWDAYEMVPWIRTFLGRIKAVKCSNEEVTNRLKADIVEMAKMYQLL